MTFLLTRAFPLPPQSGKNASVSSSTTQGAKASASTSLEPSDSVVQDLLGKAPAATEAETNAKAVAPTDTEAPTETETEAATEPEAHQVHKCAEMPMLSLWTGKNELNCGTLPPRNYSKQAASVSPPPGFPSFDAGLFGSKSPQPIGAGSSKTVHRAIYTGQRAGSLCHGDTVALLYFKDNVGPDLGEYGVMANTRAKHLTRFFGTLAPRPDDPRICLVSDFAAHGSLLHFFECAEEEETEVSLLHKLTIAKQAGEGLLSLHQHELVHADVAARNVLVYTFDEYNHHNTLVKLSDYGLVREKSDYTNVAAASEEHSADGELAPKWAAWESLTRDKFYPTSDVWSFAVLIWEVLTKGWKPYCDIGDTKMAMINHLKDGHRLQRPDIVDDALWAVMAQCWREKRKGRPTLDAVLAQLAQSLEREAARQVAANEARWTLPDFDWSFGDIALTAELDAELQYTMVGAVAVADPPLGAQGSTASRLANAIEAFAFSEGGRRGGPSSAKVIRITVAKNLHHILAFNTRLHRLQTQRKSPPGGELFNGRWDTDADGLALPKAIVEEKHAVYERLRGRFAETGFSSDGGVKVVLMWHGVPSEQVADAILATGLSSRVKGNTDEGFFGKGIYLTPQAEYAAFFANRERQLQSGQTYTLLLCAVCIANAYPVTRSADYAQGAPFSKFHYDHGDAGTPKALKSGFDAHFVAVSKDRGYQATTAGDADYDELVVASEEQVLPFAKVTVRTM